MTSGFMWIGLNLTIKAINFSTQKVRLTDAGEGTLFFSVKQRKSEGTPLGIHAQAPTVVLEYMCMHI